MICFILEYNFECINIIYTHPVFCHMTERRTANQASGRYTATSPSVSRHLDTR
jgi:hypothetical protein